MDELENQANELDRPERTSRTPITEAAGALWGACRFFVWFMSQGVNKKETKEELENYFFKELFGKTFDDPETDGDKAVHKIGTLHKKIDGFEGYDENSAPLVLLEVMGVIVDYAVQAMKVQKNDEYNLAWSYASDAQYWWGILNAEFTRKSDPGTSEMSLNARKAVQAKLAKDPKQIAKSQVKECWLRWQNGNHPLC